MVEAFEQQRAAVRVGAEELHGAAPAPPLEREVLVLGLVVDEADLEHRGAPGCRADRQDQRAVPVLRRPVERQRPLVDELLGQPRQPVQPRRPVRAEPALRLEAGRDRERHAATLGLVHVSRARRPLPRRLRRDRTRARPGVRGHGPGAASQPVRRRAGQRRAGARQAGRVVAAGRGHPDRGRARGPSGDGRDQWSRLPQPDLRRRMGGLAPHRPGRGRPARGADPAGAGGADRLQRPQRRQGDARRAPAHDDDRRRPRAAARVPRAPRRPPEPPRRLGHPVRDADRAPARRGRGLRRGTTCSVDDLNAFYQEARAEVRRRPDFADRARQRVVLAAGRRRATRCALAASWSTLSSDYFTASTTALGVHAHRRRPRRREHLQRRAGRHRAPSSRQPGSPTRATAPCASSSTASPAARASRCR